MKHQRVTRQTKRASLTLKTCFRPISSFCKRFFLPPISETGVAGIRARLLADSGGPRPDAAGGREC
ncbi:hypothetical protein MC885_003532 [Smutsia gigantea]|nr:hypothetical protein MC885_003532 [Smutsia gigantea]